MAAEAKVSEPNFPFPLLAEHVAGFAERSPAVGRILAGLDSIVQAYNSADQDAIDGQSQFKKVATDLNASALATAVIGAVILVLGGLKPTLPSVAVEWAL